VPPKGWIAYETPRLERTIKQYGGRHTSPTITPHAQDAASELCRNQQGACQVQLARKLTLKNDHE
jgi:hypothetical protein